MSTRRLPPIDKAKEALINGLETSKSPEPIKVSLDHVTDLSIDELLLKGLTIIDRTLRVVQTEVSTGIPSRESIMNLKDCMSMLHELKKQEKDLMEKLSDEDLKNYVDNESLGS